MKNFLSINRIQVTLICLLFTVVSCRNSTSDDKVVKRPGDSTSSEKQTLCFRRTDGNQNQDTTFLQLEINGEAVTGIYNWLPFEKDSRKGTFNGTIKNELIKGTWVFMQEGMTDSLPAEFKQNGDGLLVRTYSIDTKTGKEFLSDTARFSTALVKIPCN